MTAARAWVWTTVLVTVAALACAVALAPSAGTPPMKALTWLLFAGSSVHVASTGWLFTVPAVRAYARHHTLRCLWVPAGLVVLGITTAAAVGPATYQWLLMPFFGWQLWHYQKQNIGVTALASSAERTAPLHPAERRPLLLAAGSAIAALAARPGMLGLRVASVAHALFPLAAAAYMVAVVAGLAAIAGGSRTRRTASFCATYLVSLFFVLPVFCMSSPYAAVGGMTVAHGLQYLLLVSLVAGAGRRAALPLGQADAAGQYLADRRRRPELGLAHAQRGAARSAGLRRLRGHHDGALRDRRRALANARPAGARFRDHAPAVPGADGGGASTSPARTSADGSSADIGWAT